MWSDNETSDDLLGFKVHSDLIREVVTDADLLPVVLGVFGDWGGGKSSIMRMLQAELEAETYQDVVCLYFNGWMFAGYEDAKSAILTAILIELGEHKRFGLKVRDRIVGLLGRIQWMEAGKLALKHVGVPLAVAAVTGGMGGAHTFLGSFMHPHHEALEDTKKKDEKGTDEEKNWLDKLIAKPGKPDLLEVRKFREEFEGMLKETGIRSLVVIIDDLDRCLPDRIIETLEAIKLFVAVPKTAFVIGADPRIVRHAIATRYASKEIDTVDPESDYDLAQDYLEKLIQIPYYLPRLSPAEMETYINLLLCQKHLPAPTGAKVLERVSAKRDENCYTAFSYGDVRDAMNGETIPDDLGAQLAWSSAVSLSITEGLKGNPRQVKRMLNAMVLRTKLARIAKLSILPDVLAKLMVLEYTMPARFRELDAWQTASQGFPEQLKALEQAAQPGAETKQAAADDATSEWKKPRTQNWLAMAPPLSSVDLRDYFWVARDKTKSTLASASLVSPYVRRLFGQLIGDNQGEQGLAVKEVQALDAQERDSLLALLEQQMIRLPSQEEGPEALRALAEAGTEGALPALITAVSKAAPETMAPSIVAKLALLSNRAYIIEHFVFR